MKQDFYNWLDVLNICLFTILVISNNSILINIISLCVIVMTGSMQYFKFIKSNEVN